MLLICSRPDMIRLGYERLLRAAREGEVTRERIHSSLRRIADFKTLIQPPLPFDLQRFRSISDEVAELNRKLNYTYGGRI
jgi:hypothetical protein